jgi:hypothetical protein
MSPPFYSFSEHIFLNLSSRSKRLIQSVTTMLHVLPKTFRGVSCNSVADIPSTTLLLRYIYVCVVSAGFLTTHSVPQAAYIEQ